MFSVPYMILYNVCDVHLFLQVKRVNSEAYKKTFEEIVRNIDKMENECIPSVTLAKQEVKGLIYQLYVLQKTVGTAILMQVWHLSIWK